MKKLPQKEIDSIVDKLYNEFICYYGMTNLKKIALSLTLKVKREDKKLKGK